MELVWMLVPDEMQHLLPGSTLQPHRARSRLRRVIAGSRRLRSMMARPQIPAPDTPDEQLSTRVRQTFNEYVQAIIAKGYQRVVIFVDDLDRCQPDVTLKLLDLVKVNLIGSTLEDPRVAGPLPVVFVFAIDHQTLVRAVSQPDSPTPTADYARYLDKIFDLRISLPRVQQGGVSNLITGLLDTRHPEVRAYMNRVVGDRSPGGAAPGTTLRDLLVDVVSRYEELRTARFMRRIINKLMVFAYAGHVEQVLARALGDKLCDAAGMPVAEADRQEAAARVMVAWHVFGQAWLTTRTAAMRDDGLGLLLLLGLWQELESPSELPKALDELRKYNVSASGIRFLRTELIQRLRSGHALLADIGRTPGLRAPTGRGEPEGEGGGSGAPDAGGDEAAGTGGGLASTSEQTRELSGSEAQPADDVGDGDSGSLETRDLSGLAADATRGPSGSSPNQPTSPVHDTSTDDQPGGGPKSKSSPGGTAAVLMQDLSEIDDHVRRVHH